MRVYPWQVENLPHVEQVENLPHVEQVENLPHVEQVENLPHVEQVCNLLSARLGIKPQPSEQWLVRTHLPVA